MMSYDIEGEAVSRELEKRRRIEAKSGRWMLRKDILFYSGKLGGMLWLNEKARRRADIGQHEAEKK